MTRTQLERANVWTKSQGHCWYCGEVPNPFLDFHVDHAIPVARGGSHHFDNLLPCCQSCNSRKGDKTLEEFRAVHDQDTFWFEREGYSMDCPLPSTTLGFY